MDVWRHGHESDPRLNACALSLSTRVLPRPCPVARARLRGVGGQTGANFSGTPGILRLFNSEFGGQIALGVGELPFYYYTDKDGDQIALPCTERMVTTRVTSTLLGIPSR